ncbi:type I restriction endonuclease subunit R [Candidatus Microgenomates bacterium]|nr:type I restriction endonuclease subunit R [Candidatus Microgenomates bacterium]
MNLNEATLAEQPVLEWLKELGYEYVFGPDLAPGAAFAERDNFREVILLKRLEQALRRINPELPDKAIEDAIYQIKNVEHPNLEIVNKEVYRMLTEGIRVEVEDENGEKRGRFARVIDFKNLQNNEFLVVNQFAIQGIEKVRRPDIIVFVNGVPVAIFEVKNPTLESATIQSAYYQLQEYKKDIPDIFKYNQVLVVSDTTEARHGTISSPWEWFSVWKGVESEDEKHTLGTTELEVLVKGVFQKLRFLDILENFIIFEADSEKDVSKYTKKMCLYHQYFGVNKAVSQTIRAITPRGNKRIGVFWHSQGSGKSISMVFYVNKTKDQEALKSPTYVFLTDRNDLDNQLFKTFLRSGYDKLAKQAEGVKDLKEKLREAGAEIIFTTIQKFQGETYSLLSNRENIIVIADEAHRSEYAKLAANVRIAIPNASFMGITGTPVSLNNRDTRLVFGDHITTYKMNKAVEDGATVPIFYEGHLVPLHLTNYFIDEEYDRLLAEHEYDVKEVFKKKFARLEQAVGAKERLEQIASDIITHFNNRGLEGKGMIVTISRKVGVELYKLLAAQPNAPEIALVISAPEKFQEQIQKELDSKEIEKRFKNSEDPLKLVVVCDMWLTGFDVAPLHTMYIDKPLKGHTLIQAIARVNRIWKDKPAGLIVDYIGIADDLKKALSIYSSDIQKEAMLPLEDLIAKMMEKYDVVKSMFASLEFSNWKKLQGPQVTRLLQQAVDMIITDEKTGTLDEEKKNRFLKEAESLFKLHAFVMPHHQAHEIRSDVEFFQAVKKVIVKRIIIDGPYPGEDTETAIRELISKSIAAEGVIDIFAMKGKDKPDISIFDEKFLEEVKNMRLKNLAIEVLKKLLQDELRIRLKKNLVRYKSLMEILEDIIEDYENNIINSAKVIERLIELAKKIKKEEAAWKDLGLSEEELAFYDAIADTKKSDLKNGKLKNLVRELVRMIRRDLTVDWTNNETVKSKIRANVRLLLLRNNFAASESERIVEVVFKQAAAFYQDWSPGMFAFS